jgi:TRAP-type C4-dicarboxylate transport system substrate-binding protein
MTRGIFIGLLALLAATHAGAQTRWEIATEYPASAMAGEGVAFFAKLVTERSGGRLTVMPSFDAAKGIKSAGMVAAVQEGRVQAGDAFGGALGPVHPLLALSSLPFVATSLEDARRLADVARPAYAKVFGSLGQRLLYTTPWPASGIWSKAPVTSAADLARLSIRTYDATSTAVLAAAGAKAANLSFADAMPKLKQGAVDAVLSSGDGGAGRRLWDFTPHFCAVNYALPLSFAILNAGAYDALPDDLKRIVDDTAAETEARQWGAIGTRLAENYARMRENGVTIADPAPAEVASALAKAAEGPLAEWRRQAGPEGEAILAAFAKR